MSSHTSVSIEPLAVVFDLVESFLYYTIEVILGAIRCFCCPPREEEFTVFYVVTTSLVHFARNLLYIGNTLAIIPMHPVLFFVIDSIFADSIRLGVTVTFVILFLEFFLNVFLVKVSLFVALAIEIEE